MNQKKVAWVLINLVHYHEARWDAFSRLSGHETWIVELANRDSAFSELEGKTSGKTGRLTLFPGVNWRAIDGQRRRQAIWAALERINPDVVCVNGWSVGGALASMQWSLKRQRSVVIFSDSNVFDRGRLSASEFVKGRLVKLGRSALVGGTDASAYLQTLGLPSTHVFLGYDVVDNRHFARYSGHRVPAFAKPRAAPRGRFFLAAARFEEKKNHLGLLGAYALYRERAGQDTWPLVILGDGRLRPAIEARRSELSLEGDVILPGFVGYEMIPAWYQHAGCFVHSSTSEQWGLVVNEAMAAGLPVLVSRRCGCATDLVQEGVNGFTFDPYRPEQLAAQMYRIAHEEDDASELGRASELIIAEWGPERFASGLSDAVDAALSTPHKKASLFDRILLAALSHR